MPPSASEIVPRLRDAVLRPLRERFAGRDELIELMALVLVAGENLLIVGPPGTAKSELVAEFARRVHGRYFEYLLTRFTEPSELFGPVDIARLREGEVTTRTRGMLPEAEIAFLDEVFNAGSAILNTLLGILNDGVFRRAGETRQSPLISVLGATNSIPDDPELRALEDRFTVRVEVDLLEDRQIGKLLERGWAIESSRLSAQNDGAPATAPVSCDEIRVLHRAVAACDVASIRSPLETAIRRIRAGGVFLSDRRAVKLQRLAAASAVLCGRTKALAADLWPLRYLWERSEDRSLLDEIVDELTSTDAGDEETHPLLDSGRPPAELLERLCALEGEVEELAEPIISERFDDLHTRLQDLDSERRWCRPRSEGEADQLRELSQRLESLTTTLVRKEDAE
jgi:MoxR-like ATPase